MLENVKCNQHTASHEVFFFRTHFGFSFFTGIMFNYIQDMQSAGGDWWHPQYLNAVQKCYNLEINQKAQCILMLSFGVQVSSLLSYWWINGSRNKHPADISWEGGWSHLYLPLGFWVMIQQFKLYIFYLLDQRCYIFICQGISYVSNTYSVISNNNYSKTWKSV